MLTFRYYIVQQTTPPREGKRIRIGCNETPVIHDRLIHNSSVTAEEAELPVPTFELHDATSIAEVMEGCRAVSPCNSTPSAECETQLATTTPSSNSPQELLNDKLTESLSAPTEEHPSDAPLPVRDSTILNSDAVMSTRMYSIFFLISNQSITLNLLQKSLALATCGLPKVHSGFIIIQVRIRHILHQHQLSLLINTHTESQVSEMLLNSPNSPQITPTSTAVSELLLSSPNPQLIASTSTAPMQNTPEKSIFDYVSFTESEERKRQTARKRQVNAAGWTTTNYDHELYTYTEVPECYDTLASSVRLKDLSDYMSRNPFLCTGWARRDKHVPKSVEKHNAELCSKKLKEWHPLDNQECKLKAPDTHIGPIFLQYYKGCSDIICKAYKKELKCTANIMIHVNNDGMTCTIKARGRHCEHYKPIHSHLVKRPEVKNLIKKNLNDKPTTLMAKLQNEVPEHHMTKQQVRQAKYNEKRAMRLNNGNPLGGALDFIEENDKWFVLKEIGDRTVDQMKNDDFTLVLIFRPIWTRCCKHFNDIVGFDGVHKCLKLAFLDKMYGMVPMYVLTCTDNNRMTQVPAVIITTTFDGQLLAHCLTAIGNQYEADFQQKWSRTFMIDDGAVEKKCMELIGASYFICKFHIVQRWTSRINSLSVSLAEKGNLMNHLFLMFASTTEQVYLRLYRTLKQRFPANLYGSFHTYFDSTWHAYGGDEQFYMKWISAKRSSSFGLWNTNNATERVMRDVQDHLDHQTSRNIEAYVKEITTYIELRAYNRKSKTQSETDAEKRLKDGHVRWCDPQKYPWKPCDTNDKIYYFASSNQQADDISAYLYTANIEVMCCNCLDYLHNCRPCKHLYCAMLAYLHMQEITLTASEEKDPFAVIRITTRDILTPSRTDPGPDAGTAWPSIRIGRPERETRARRLRQAASNEAASSYENLLAQENEDLMLLDVIGVRYNGAQLEVKVAADTGATWLPLTVGLEQPFASFLTDLKDYLEPIKAKHSIAAVVSTIELRDEEYTCSYDAVADVPIGPATKVAVKTFLKKFKK